MAKTTQTNDLFTHLRAGGLRKRAAKIIARAANGRGQPAGAAQRTVAELKTLLSEAEDWISGGPSQRRAAARKAANTRKRNDQRRTSAAKKAARTRSKSGA